MDSLRLQVFMAKAGVASRRNSELLIQQGKVYVNGIQVKDMGFKVISSDTIKVNGKVVEISNNQVYIALNKPIGYVTTTKDQFNRKTVIDLLKGVSTRVYPVGRLDYNTSGLLILTNDGSFAYKITHPKHNIYKTYIAEIKGVPTQSEIKKFENGILLDRIITSHASIKIMNSTKSGCVVEIVIHEGRNRQIRRMLLEIGHPAITLKRIRIGTLTLGNLKEGCWRHLNQSEINRFK